jgi:hypothetical protein
LYLTQVIIDQPVVEFFLIDTMMDGGVVQHDNRERHPLLALGDTVD